MLLGLLFGVAATHEPPPPVPTEIEVPASCALETYATVDDLIELLLNLDANTFGAVIDGLIDRLEAQSLGEGVPL